MVGKIQKLFEEHDVNISQMSRNTGIAYGTLYDIANNKTTFDKIKIGTLIKIAQEFGMSVDDIVGNIDVESERYELCSIYDAMNSTGKIALLAAARGLREEFSEQLGAAAFTARPVSLLFPCRILLT